MKNIKLRTSYVFVPASLLGKRYGVYCKYLLLRDHFKNYPKN
jgi:hypothetical protein